MEREQGQRIARYAEIIGLCALELAQERSKSDHPFLAETIRRLSFSIIDEVPEKEKDE